MSDPLVSDTALMIFQYVCYCTLNQLIDVFGVVTNIINMICFIKQGFKDSVNVSLFGLAVSDLGCLLTLVWLNISMIPAFQHEDLPFDQLDTQYLTASWPHVVFSRISIWITAFITLERCLCITSPLKVKLILTSQRTRFIIIFSSVIFILSVCPVYCVNVYTHVFLLDRNKTLMGIFRTDNHKLTEQVVLTINVILQFGTYISVIVCTVVLICKLHRKRQWRHSVASGNCDKLLSRDQKVAKMIVLISTVFIVCFIPNCVTFLAVLFETEFALEGKYKNTLILMFGFGVLLESINSSVNIFIYYNMSTKYRVTFLQIFRLQSDGHHN